MLNFSNLLGLLINYYTISPVVCSFSKFKLSAVKWQEADWEKFEFFFRTAYATDNLMILIKLKITWTSN